jgi:alginate O-acetyltransferase complex protein AlgI
MTFTTPEFVIFFLLFFGLYALLPVRRRKVLLLVASYLFYGSWNAKFLLLLAASTLVDYAVGGALYHSESHRRRQLLISASIGFNLGVLGVFKYFNFFVDSAAAGLAALGLEVDFPTLQVILPVGISFYTFQTMSYTLDIYRRQLEPTPSFLDFAVYVSLFPQLVAGPIERAAHLLPQLARLGAGGNRADLSGFGLIALGVFKKAVIADNVAVLVELSYADPSATHPAALWIGTYAFAIQIYCDFSGYSDIAVGLGRLLGLDLVQNFRAPYASAGPAEFWRRWHISLSTWLRDYLYIPLGGNRGGWFAVRRNLLLTMLLGGLWHGAVWNYVAWGAFHGLLLVIFRWRFLHRIQERLEAGSTMLRRCTVGLRRFAFFHVTCIGWGLFRAESLQDCWIVVWKLLNFTEWNLGDWLRLVEQSGEGGYLAWSCAAMATIVLVQNLWPVGTFRVVDLAWRAPLPLRIAGVGSLLYLAAVFSPAEPPPFIYFAF